MGEIPYTQSMADVISIIVYYFYETKGIASFNDSFINYLTHLSTKILLKYSIPMIINEFSLFSNYYSIFRRLAAKNNFTVSEEESLLHMKYILTLFERLNVNINDKYFLYSVI